MLRIKTLKKGRVKRELEKRAPKHVETGKKTLLLQGTKMSNTSTAVLTELYLMKKGSAVRYTRKNENIRPFESGGETYLEFFSLKTDCSIFCRGKMATRGWITFALVIENLNLAGVDRTYVCTAVSSSRVFFTHCGLQLKKSGSIVPRMELVEVGLSMDFVVRRRHLPNDTLCKEAMKTAKDQPEKKVKNVSHDSIQGEIRMIYIPDQKIGDMVLQNKSKGVKRDRCEAKMNNYANEHAPKKRKEDSM